MIKTCTRLSETIESVKSKSSIIFSFLYLSAQAGGTRWINTFFCTYMCVFFLAMDKISWFTFEFVIKFSTCLRDFHHKTDVTSSLFLVNKMKKDAVGGMHAMK